MFEVAVKDLGDRAQSITLSDKHVMKIAASQVGTVAVRCVGSTLARLTTCSGQVARVAVKQNNKGNETKEGMADLLKQIESVCHTLVLSSLSLVWLPRVSDVFTHSCARLVQMETMLSEKALGM